MIVLKYKLIEYISYRPSYLIAMYFLDEEESQYSMCSKEFIDKVKQILVYYYPKRHD